MNGQCSCGYRSGRISSIDCRCVTHRELNERLRKIDPNEGYYQKEIDELKANKQDKLIAGQNITIEGSLISADLDSTNFYNKTETDELLAEKQDTLTAGENITISEDNVISADAHMLVTLTPTGAPVGGVTDYTWTSEHTYAELVAGLDKVAFKTTEAGSENILVPTELYEALESGQNVIFGMIPSNDATVPKITSMELIVRPDNTAKTTETTALISNTTYTAGDNIEISPTNEISAIIPNVYGFDTVADMKASTELKAGDYARTSGYYAKDDGGAATYKIRAKSSSDAANDRDLVATSDTSIIAEIELDGDTISVKQFGAKGNKTDDDSGIIQSAIDYASTKNITNVYMPKGEYLVTTPLVLYNFVNLKGENRENTTIFKSGHLTDNIYSKDCILTATKKTGDSLNYPRYIEIDNIQLQSLDRNDQSEYGLYIDVGAFFTITHFASRFAGCCIYLGDIWLSTVKEVSTGYGTIGLQTRAGTTLDINDIYTFGNSQYGYYIQGANYSHFSNMACDGAPDSIAYYFYFANVSIDGIGCEAENYTNALKIVNSNITLADGSIHANPTNPDASLMVLQSSSVVAIDCIFGTQKSGGIYSTAGKFLQFVGVGSSLVLKNPGCYTQFETQNINNDVNNTVTIIDKNNIASMTGSRLGYIGSSYPIFDDTIKTDRLNLSTLQSQLSAPCSDVPTSAYENTSIAWARDNRPVGALIPNAALNRSGAVAFVKSSESKICQLVNPIESVSTDTSTTTLTFSSITLDDLAEFRLDKVTTKWRVRKVGGENKYNISSVDYDTGTIVVGTVAESFEVGDYIELFPPRDVRECDYIPVQGVLKGTTANRPQYPKEGTMYLDTTLGKPIWRIGSRWVDATGTTV